MDAPQSGMKAILVIPCFVAQNEPRCLESGAFNQNVMEANYIEEIFAGFYRV